MGDNTRPEDPFAKLAELGTDQKLFSSPLVYRGVPKPEVRAPARPARKFASKPTRNVTQPRDTSRETSREKPRGQSSDQPRDTPRDISRGIPSRDEIQEFSFRLRDVLKVKVQAEVPAGWQDELEQIARDLDVKKLELYRFILGEFLGKVQRKKSP